VGGVVDAQFNVAIMYKAGKGLPKNQTEALRFMRLAATAGHDQAIRRLKRWKDK
jgi:TPR repeat protein